MRKILYLDCHSGISGDMFLGAMLDAGLSFEALRDALVALSIDGYQLTFEPFHDKGIQGSRLHVTMIEQEQPTRHFSDIATLLHESKLPPSVRDTASAIFRTLGEAEAAVHGVTLEEVHFHEVGAVDAIVDITGAAIALNALGIEQVYASPLPLTRGHLRMAHGLMPLPAPATLEILRRVKAPWVPCPIEGELVTPTGAAILATVARFETPAITIEQVGYGFGQKKIAWPNCVRACIGHEYGYIGATRQETSDVHTHDQNHEHHAHIHGHSHEHTSV
ncbi:MAG: hypothetical protein NVS4B11_19420 [Ktedonobacteraceae bacterium]